MVKWKILPHLLFGFEHPVWWRLQDNLEMCTLYCVIFIGLNKRYYVTSRCGFAYGPGQPIHIFYWQKRSFIISDTKRNERSTVPRLLDKHWVTKYFPQPPFHHQSLTLQLAFKACLGHIMTPLLVFKVTGIHASASYIRKCSTSPEWNSFGYDSEIQGSQLNADRLQAPHGLTADRIKPNNRGFPAILNVMLYFCQTFPLSSFQPILHYVWLTTSCNSRESAPRKAATRVWNVTQCDFILVPGDCSCRKAD